MACLVCKLCNPWCCICTVKSEKKVIVYKAVLFAYLKSSLCVALLWSLPLNNKFRFTQQKWMCLWGRCMASKHTLSWPLVSSGGCWGVAFCIRSIWAEENTAAPATWVQQLSEEVGCEQLGASAIWSIYVFSCSCTQEVFTTCESPLHVCNVFLNWIMFLF